MKKLFLILLLLFPLFSFSQQRYPIKTIMQGDSVVIMTEQQSIQINKLIDEQTKKIADLEALLDKGDKENEKLNSTIDDLNGQISKNKSTISYLNDTLKRSDFYYTNKIDSFDKEMVRIREWFMQAAITNTFIYVDWDSRSLKVVDLNGYRSKVTIFGKFKFIPENIPSFDWWRKHRINNKIGPVGDINKLHQMEPPIKIEGIQWQE